MRLLTPRWPGFAASPQLEHLNLYGNAGVTDAGLETLAEIATLRELYLLADRRIGRRR